MRINAKLYRSVAGRNIQDDRTRIAFEDLAQKVEALARVAGGTSAPVDGFPSGAVVLWFGDVADIPAGWSEFAPARGRFFRHMLSGGTPQAVGGSDTHSHTMNHGHSASTGYAGAHNHGISSESSHNHTINSQGSYSPNVQNLAGGFGSGGSYQAANSSSYVTVNSHNHGGATGTAGGHNHGGTTSSVGDHNHSASVGSYSGSTASETILPPHIDGILIQKD